MLMPRQSGPIWLYVAVAVAAVALGALLTAMFASEVADPASRDWLLVRIWVPTGAIVVIALVVAWLRR